MAVLPPLSITPHYRESQPQPKWSPSGKYAEHTPARRVRFTPSTAGQEDDPRAPPPAAIYQSAKYEVMDTAGEGEDGSDSGFGSQEGASPDPSTQLTTPESPAMHINTNIIPPTPKTKSAAQKKGPRSPRQQKQK